MKLLTTVTTLVAFPCILAAQSTRPDTTIRLEVRSLDPARVVTMQVTARGSLFKALGVARGPDGGRVGGVQLSGGGGTASTPAALEVGAMPGVVSFDAPLDGPAIELRVAGTGMYARGRSVRVVRDSVSGRLQLEASAQKSK